MKFLSGFFLFFFIFFNFSWGEKIRVLLKESGVKITITAESAFQITRLKNKKVIYQGKPGEKIICQRVFTGIKIGERIFNFSLRIKATEGKAIKINNHLYRGEIKIVPHQKKLLVINEINIEEYLYGVIQHEIHPAWPDEVLKAQSVASRSYALFQKKHMRKALYDVKDTIFSQVYNGVGRENKHTNQIIDLTKGEVLLYQGEIIDARYHATCGGHTDDVSYVWGTKPRPYLEGVKCSYCTQSPHYKWERILSIKKIKNVLNKNGYEIKEIKGIKLFKSPYSGRVIEIEIKTEDRTLYFKANKFRLFLGTEVIRSTFFEIEQISLDELKFTGYGWGHGVGMCQWGAKGMAEAGKTYREILFHYYPGTKIEKIK
jgi:stage II sporulation protein D